MIKTLGENLSPINKKLEDVDKSSKKLGEVSLKIKFWKWDTSTSNRKILEMVFKQL